MSVISTILTLAKEQLKQEKDPEKHAMYKNHLEIFEAALKDQFMWKDLRQELND